MLHRHTLTDRYTDRQIDKTHIHTHARHVHMNIDRLAASAVYHQANGNPFLDEFHELVTLDNQW